MDQGGAWAKGVRPSFKHEGGGAARAPLQLPAWKASLGKADQEAAKALLGCLTPRREMIRHPEFPARGWQIGWGPMESPCRTTTDRWKGSSRRWEVDTARAVMALACLENRNGWDPYWF